MVQAVPRWWQGMACAFIFYLLGQALRPPLNMHRRKTAEMPNRSEATQQSAVRFGPGPWSQFGSYFSSGLDKRIGLLAQVRS